MQLIGNDKPNLSSTIPDVNMAKAWWNSHANQWQESKRLLAGRPLTLAMIQFQNQQWSGKASHYLKILAKLEMPSLEKNNVTTT